MREFERGTELRYFCEIESHEREFILWSEIGVGLVG